MLAGERHERLAQIAELVDGYNEFHDFDPRQLPLLEGLRSLRLMHYSAWLARRWDDPAFPPSFPGSAANVTGASRCWCCANNWRRWTRNRCGCSEPPADRANGARRYPSRRGAGEGTASVPVLFRGNCAQTSPPPPY